MKAGKKQKPDDAAAEKKQAERKSAIQRLAKVCGKALADAVERGSRLKTARDLNAFVAQSDEKMRTQAGLIADGWAFTKAKLYKAKKLTLNHTLRDAANLAMTKGFNLTVEIEGWRFVVQRSKAK